MRYSFVDFKSIVEQTIEKIVGNYISNIAVINSHDFVLSFSMYRKEKLLISLNHNQPFIALTNNNESFTTTIGLLNDTLRKELKDAYIKDIEILNDDKVLKVNFEKSNEIFEREKKSLILELIPHRQNLFLINNENQIIFVLHPNNIESKRPLLKGMIYSLPDKNENYSNQTPMSKNELELFVKEYLNTSREIKLNERYDVLFKFIKSKIKSLKNKIQILEEEKLTATINLKYQDHGNMVLALANDKEELDRYLFENSITYDKKLSIGQFANLLFKKYKKAKRTIEIDTLEINKTFNQLNELELCLVQVPFMDDEDLYELAQKLMPHKFKGNKKKINKTIFSFIDIDNVKIYFGKSSLQNEELTFKFAKNNFSYFHIKDYHGSHVIVATEKLTNELILTACEMCLLLSNKTTGDIMYTQVKNLKKGQLQGQVLMTCYKLVTLREIRLTTIDKLKHFKK